MRIFHIIGLLAIIAAFSPFTHTHAASLFQTTIEIISSPMSLSLTNRFVLSYGLIEPNIVIHAQIPETFNAAKSKLYGHEIDVMMVPYTISELDMLVNPSIGHVPFVAIPIVPIYNLVNITSLRLSRATMAGIWLGLITKWSHPQIKADNPSLNLPNESINVILPAASSFQSRVFTLTMHALNDTFAASIPVLDLPNWPRDLYAKYLTSSNQAALVLATPFSISFTTWQAATEYGSNIAAVENASGSMVTMSAHALDLALNEAATVRIQEVPNPTKNRAVEMDLTAASGAGSWPIIATEYLWIDRTYSRQTCASRLAMVNYLVWLFTSEDVRTILAAQQVGAMPQVVIDQLDIVGRLLNNVVCRGAPAKATEVVNGITISGDPRTDLINSLLLIHYNANFEAVDSDTLESYEYRWTSNPSSLAVEQVLFQEVSMALVFSENVDQSLWNDAIVGNPDFVILPTFLFGVELVFNPAITTKTTLPTDTRLVVTIDIIFSILSGDIKSWKHASILSLNPVLAQAFTDSNDDTDAMIWLVYACDSFQSSKMGYFLANVLAIQNPQYKPYMDEILSGTIDMCVSVTDEEAQTHFVSAETQIGPSVGQWIGGFGYQPLGLYNPNVGTLDVQIGDTVRQATHSSMLACAHDTLDFDTMMLPVLQSKHESCYPFTQTMYLVAPRAYNTSLRGPGSCISGSLSVDYGLYLINQTSNDNSLHLAGIARVTEDEMISEYIQQLLQGAIFTCDGIPMIEAQPIDYEVSAPLKSFASAMASIGMGACVAGLVFLIMHRRHPAVLTAKPGLLTVSSLGCMMLFAALIPLVQKAEDGSCSALMWLINVGYTLLFTPSYVKLTRLYLMHSGSTMISRVHKLSNQSMHLILILAVLLDITVLSAWQGVGPFAPVSTSRLEDLPPTTHIYTQCGQPDDGLPFLYAVGLVKGLLLIAGAMMAFTVRRVITTFNEQKHTALLMYNTVSAAALCIPIAFVTSLLGDSWTVIFVVCVLWIVVVAWVCIFAPKIIAIASRKSTSDLIEKALTHTDAVKSVSLGFSFHQIGLMSQEVLESYIRVLEDQAREAKDRLHCQNPVESDEPAASPSHGHSHGHSGHVTEVISPSHPTLQHSESLHRRKMTMGSVRYA